MTCYNDSTTSINKQTDTQNMLILENRGSFQAMCVFSFFECILIEWHLSEMMKLSFVALCILKRKNIRFDYGCNIMIDFKDSTNEKINKNINID